MFLSSLSLTKHQRTTDRMLVRTCYTKSETLSPQFDEIKNRTTRNLHYMHWAEYMVAWRKDRIEIYKDHV